MQKMRILKHPTRKRGEVVEVDDARAEAWDNDGIAEPVRPKAKSKKEESVNGRSRSY